ncbi:putative helicase [Tetrabaena socialis]|uniref:RNA helicase n=1 Tax=Tetrabaena socialis TaxID=47790 RepID=A0A2J8AFL9_9CHLO|nr:putative helicase [Tetrabaena socialis]|eukprot:PNH11314.1 putative helicase [Tetrabaena socialis]
MAKPAGIDAAAVRAYALALAGEHPDGAVPIFSFRFCNAFSSMPKMAEVRSWLRGHPDDYLVQGQYGGPKTFQHLPVPLYKEATKKLYCRICRTAAHSADAMRGHLGSARHQQALEAATPEQLRSAVADCLNLPDDALHTCELCSAWFASHGGLLAHCQSSRHQLRQYYLLMRQANLLTADTNNVLVARLPDPLPSMEPGTSASYTLTVTNLSGSTQTLRGVRLLQPVDGVSLHDAYGVTASAVGPAAVELGHGASYGIDVVLSPRFLGVMRGLIMFDFGAFQVVRAVVASCAAADTEEEVAKAAAGGGGRRRRRKLEPQNEDVVPGEAPAGDEGGNSSKPKKLERPIGQHRVPAYLRQLVERQDWAAVERQLGGPAGEADSVREYAERLKVLLWLEELQHEIDIRQYDMPGQTMDSTKGGSSIRLWLQVPGLAENRPSVLKGDRLYVRPSDGSYGSREWEGIVHVVEREQVLLGFDRGFVGGGIWMQGRRFDVRFTVNRSVFNRLQAVLSRTAAGDLNPLLLLPGRACAPLPPAPPGLPLTGPDSDYFDVPTSARTGAGAAAAAPSLFGFNIPFMGGAGRDGRSSRPVRVGWQNARLNAEQRLAVREVVRGAHAPLPYIIFGPPGTGKTSTLVEAAWQVLRVLPASSLLLVAPSNSAADQLFQRLRDAGHPLSEMLRICAYTRGRQRVILQLGPVILSPFAKAHRLDVSLLERLAGAAPYARREGGQQPPYQTPYTTMLLDNYRSHAHILEVPNAAFYHGQLRPAADPVITHSLLHWEGLPNKGTPMLFHHLVGRDMQEASSPSWCNPDEVKQVALYVKQLRDLRRNPVTGGDIGIISPYRKQVQRIRAILASTDRSIKVGSVEEFQGQERRVIIISTVRSSSQYLAFDSKHRLGFLSNPKRFNVAITRAKALLVVVGNAEVLASDPHWRALLRFLHLKGAITGQRLPPGVREQLEAEPTAAGEGGAAGAATAKDWAVGELAAALQQLVLSSGVGGGGGGPTEEEDEQLRFLGGALEVEGGEMRRLE